MNEDNEKTTHVSTVQMASSTPNVEIVRQQRFEVGPRYTDLKFIGEGAYGRNINILENLVGKYLTYPQGNVVFLLLLTKNVIR